MRVKHHWATLALCAVLNMIGCGPSGPAKPLSNEQLQLYSRTGMSHASISVPGGPNYFSVSHDVMRELIASLYPIQKVFNNPLTGEHYTLSYQAGLHPTWVDVRVDGTFMMYSWGDYDFSVRPKLPICGWQKVARGSIR